MTARVVFTSGFSRLGGVREFTVEAKNLRGVIKAMGELYPTLGEHLVEETTVAIDGAAHAALRRIAPSCTGGQTKRPFSRRLWSRQRPVPSQAKIFTRSARLTRNTNTSPTKRVLTQRLLHQCRQAVQADAEIDRPARHHDAHPGRDLGLLLEGLDWSRVRPKSVIAPLLAG